MHPISFAVRFYIKECNLVVENCCESIERQNKEYFSLVLSIFPKLLLYTKFLQEKHIKSQHHVFMQHCFFEACTCLENQRVDVKSLENIYVYCDCLFWLNCCGFIMVRGLQRIPHFYFQIDCISNIKSKCGTCFSFFDILYFTSVANENRNVAIHMFYLAFVIMIYHTQNKSGLLEFIRMMLSYKNRKMMCNLICW